MKDTICNKAKLLYILIFPLLYISLLVGFYNYENSTRYLKNTGYSIILPLALISVGILIYLWNAVLWTLTKKYQIMANVYMLCVLGGIIFSLYFLPNLYNGNMQIYFALIDHLNYLYILLGNIIGFSVNLIIHHH